MKQLGLFVRVILLAGLTAGLLAACVAQGPAAPAGPVTPSGPVVPSAAANTTPSPAAPAPAATSPRATAAAPVPAATSPRATAAAPGQADMTAVAERDAASAQATANAGGPRTSGPVGTQPAVATPTSGVPFEVLAQGAAMVSPTDAPVFQALRGNDPARAVPAGLPDEAKTPLQQAVAGADPTLYVVICLGKQPSSGYAVRITSIEQRIGSGAEKLVVHYTLDKPDPARGAAAVMTYPFVVARVPGTKASAADVTFEGP